MANGTIAPLESSKSHPTATRLSVASDELSRILNLLHEEFPDAVHISLDFDGELRAHIDVRSYGVFTAVEASLPGIGGGMFTEVRHGSTPRHPFLHRITATVAKQGAEFSPHEN